MRAATPLDCRAMTRTFLLTLVTSLALACSSAAAQSLKVLRYAFPVAETGFDPAQISDLYSRTVAANIFEAPLTYDYLARPAKVKPQTAASMPEISDGGKRFVFRIRPGIYFADDPAFKGQRRELTAADYVYSVKRHYDPKFKSPNLFLLENGKNSRSDGAAPTGHCRQESLPLRHRGRRPAHARPLQLRAAAGRAPRRVFITSLPTAR